ncbi:hypothetical protein PSTG_11299 [Puccinia striiformis f. sp. tritici PST-78]|uniref:Uncharacterized protein n=1 Tax=Puccinia striiformis f. sp. tritici PST-78 TaxID=1165861 RepID=A0A0L0V815_9BASI|nr:hypothetical protein PSTG_11299 [Puccinia striiformis f. sp. tritici PST-78]
MGRVLSGRPVGSRVNLGSLQPQKAKADPFWADICELLNSFPSAYPTDSEGSNLILTQAQRTAENAVSIAYSTYHRPELSDHLDKKGQCMIPYPCKMCGGKFNRPMSDSSCSNLLRHQAACLVKQNDQKTSSKLASVGVSGMGDIDRREVPQLCVIWCAEAT